MTIKTLRRILRRFPSNSIISIRNGEQGEDYDISHISFSVTNDGSVTYSLVLNCGAKDDEDK